MSIMLAELSEAKHAIRNAISSANAEKAGITEACRKRNIKRIVVAGRGSSMNAGLAFKFFLDTNTDYVCAFEYPSVVTLFAADRNLEDTLYILISQSGAGPDTIKMAKSAAASGALTVAVTNDGSSELAKICDYTIDIGAGPENSVAATKTFTGEVAALQALAFALAGKTLAPDFCEESVNFALNTDFPIPPANLFGDGKAVVLSRGYTEPVAKELALKLTETCYIFTYAASVNEFQHGPKALLTLGLPVILLAPNGRAIDDYLKAAADLKEKGAYLIVFSDCEKFCSLADSFIRMPSVTEDESALVYTVGIQKFAEGLCAKLGLSPDAPRNLNKITVTR